MQPCVAQESVQEEQPPRRGEEESLESVAVGSLDQDRNLVQ